MRRTFQILMISFIFGLGLLPTSFFPRTALAADGNFGGGAGTSGDPYQIEDCLDLQAMTGSLSSYYVLNSNIDCSATSSWNSGAGFSPVGTSGSAFTGNINGNNYTISGLFINRATTYIGLFGNTSSATVTNINLTSASVTGTGRVGGLAGQASSSTFTNVSFSGSVTSSGAFSGGLIAYSSGNTISGSYTDVTLTNTLSTTTVWAGGFIGYFNGGSATTSYSTGTVTASSGYRVGGFAAEFSGGGSAGTITKCYSTVNVTGHSWVGGFIGSFYGSAPGASITDSYARGSVTLTSGGSGGGGFTGFSQSGSPTITRSYSTSAMTGSSWVGGFNGYTESTSPTVVDSFWDTETSGKASSNGVGASANNVATGKTTAQMKTQSTYTDANFNFSTTWVIDGTGAINNGYPYLEWEVVPPSAAPTVQASGLASSAVFYDQISLDWSNGDGGKRVVFAKLGNTGSAVPVDDTVYTANTVFGSGTQIGASGWYTVYNGTGTSVTVTGLSTETQYIFQVFEYNGSGPYALFLGDISNENSLTETTSALLAPTTQASSVGFSSITSIQMATSWTAGNGSKRVVFIKEGNTGSAVPVDDTVYTANTVFGSGTQIGASGWYTVYNGTGTSVTVTGLSASLSYIVQVFEYNGGSGEEKYFTGNGAGNPASVAMSAAPTGDDFETGNLTSIDWQFGGNLPWVITTGDKYAGSYSAKAGTITHNQTSYIEVTLTVDTGNITYYRKVSSEACCDHLRFYIDGSQKESISGAGSWGQSSYAVTAGSRTFRWTYSKDGSVNTGSDTAWIDDIVFPIAATPSYTLSYSAGANGSLSGTTSQIVNSGSSGSAVTAVPNSGYSFTSWSDSSTDNPRTDSNVTQNISVTASFADAVAPNVSNLLSSPSSTSATITWTTDEASSSIVNYGPTSTYGSSTAETDTSPRVTSHSVAINNLVACALYHYQTQSNDSANNTGSSSDTTFLTSGCSASSVITSSNQSVVTTAAGGSLSEDDVTLTIPVSFASSVSSATFQIHKLNGDTFFNSITLPTNQSKIGNKVYNIKALSDASTTLPSFDNPIIVSYSYTGPDIVNILESSLWIYRYDAGSWFALDSCIVNTSTKVVACETNNFSDFGLFGQTLSTVNSAGATLLPVVLAAPQIPFGGFKISINNGDAVTSESLVSLDFNAGSDIKNMAISNFADFQFSGQETYNSSKIWDLCKSVDLCEDGEHIIYAKFYTQHGQPSHTITASILLERGSNTETHALYLPRTLRRGHRGDDVKILQTFLNDSLSLTLKIDGIFGKNTKSAVVRFQGNYDLVRDGIVGPKTKAYIK